MTSDEKTSISSLLEYINADLYTLGNISNSTTLRVPQTEAYLGAYLPPTNWEVVLNYVPLEFFHMIESYNNTGKMYQIEEFNKEKYQCNPKLYAYDKYGVTNMWRPIMILNRCPSIMEFKFDYIKYYDINYFSKLMAILISRMEHAGIYTHE